MKPKTAVLAAFALALLAQAGDALAAGARHKPAHAKKKPAASHSTDTGGLPCQTVAIDPREDREIVILKLTQRMDCLEGKVNYLSEQVALQSGGAAKPFVEKPKEFVIRYPRTPEAP